jgi:hypothetical protein
MTTNSESKQSQKRQAWKQHIKAWEKSGLTQKAYCKSQHLSVVNFCYWKKKFSVNSGTGNSKFYPLAIPDASQNQNRANNSSVRIQVSGQRFSIAVSEGFNPDLLKNVINTLEGI